ADEEVSEGLQKELTTFLNDAEGKLYLDPKHRQSFCWWKGDPGPENRNPNGKVHWVLTPELYARSEDETFNLIAGKLARRNMFLGRWIRYGGFFPDYKLRLFRRGEAAFEDRAVHEDLQIKREFTPAYFENPLLHHAYPTLSSYIEHMNRYSSLGAEML